MLQQKSLSNLEYYRQNLLKTLSSFNKDHPSNLLYTESRTQIILKSYLTNSDIFGTGYIEKANKSSIKSQKNDLEEITILMNINQSSIQEVQEWLHLVSRVYVIGMGAMGEEGKRRMKASPIKKKLKGYCQVSLNFSIFLDDVYEANNQQVPYQMQFEQVLSTYLTSFPKFYEFHIHYPSSLAKQAKITQQVLEEDLQILKKYEHPPYNEPNSPRIKVLLFDRNCDMMSPLVYDYYFGPMHKEMGLDDKNQFSTAKSLMFNQMFYMDLENSSEFLTNLSQKKWENKNKLQTANFQQADLKMAKDVISAHYDSSTNHQEISLHIEQLKSIKKNCLKRARVTALMQSIVNGVSQVEEKMKGSTVIKKICELVEEESKMAEEDYLKCLMLAYMVNSFWFWEKRVVNAGVSEKYKDKFSKFAKKMQGKYSLLTEKPQGEQKFDFYRHQPSIIPSTEQLMQNPEKYSKLSVNSNESKNKETKIVIAVKGVLGYNQVALLKEYTNKKYNTTNISIICDRLVDTKQYQQLLLGSY